MLNAQEINQIANPDWIKYAFGAICVLSTVINGLIVYIFADLKSWVKKIDGKVDNHQDRILILETKNGDRK
jgi:hypothetical protein